jgi:hypothetical protein
MLALAGTAQASPMTLVNGGLGVLDSDTKLEWTANMNLGGLMTWAAANTWIATLNASNYAGHNDWRLPTLNPSDTTCSFGSGDVRYGYNCTGGELSNLFATDLGNKAGESVLTQTGDTAEQIANLALFSNVQSSVYWSGTEYAEDPKRAWTFGPGDGGQFNNYKSIALYAAAVRPGDVAASVPEPQTLALALLALGAGLLKTKRRPA